MDNERNEIDTEYERDIGAMKQAIMPTADAVKTKDHKVIRYLSANIDSVLYWVLMALQIAIILLVAFTPTVDILFGIAKGCLIAFVIITLYLMGYMRNALS